MSVIALFMPFCLDTNVTLCHNQVLQCNGISGLKSAFTSLHQVKKQMKICLGQFWDKEF